MADLFVNSDNYVWYLGARDFSNGDGGPFVTDATVTVQFQTTGGDDVGGVVTLANVAGAITLHNRTYSDGNYRGTLPSTVTLTDGAELKAVVTISKSGKTREETATVKVRSKSRKNCEC